MTWTLAFNTLIIQSNTWTKLNRGEVQCKRMMGCCCFFLAAERTTPPLRESEKHEGWGGWMRESETKPSQHLIDSASPWFSLSVTFLLTPPPPPPMCHCASLSLLETMTGYWLWNHETSWSTALGSPWRSLLRPAWGHRDKWRSLNSRRLARSLDVEKKKTTYQK